MLGVILTSTGQAQPVRMCPVPDSGSGWQPNRMLSWKRLKIKNKTQKSCTWTRAAAAATVTGGSSSCHFDNTAPPSPWAKFQFVLATYLQWICHPSTRTALPVDCLSSSRKWWSPPCQVAALPVQCVFLPSLAQLQRRRKSRIMLAAARQQEGNPHNPLSPPPSSVATYSAHSG